MQDIQRSAKHSITTGLRARLYYMQVEKKLSEHWITILTRVKFTQSFSAAALRRFGHTPILMPHEASLFAFTKFSCHPSKQTIGSSAHPLPVHPFGKLFDNGIFPIPTGQCSLQQLKDLPQILGGVFQSGTYQRMPVPKILFIDVDTNTIPGNIHGSI
jgi:hypothetical protein